MELKFTATVTLSEADIRRLIEAEVVRRHKDVKVVKVDYNISQGSGYVGGNFVVGANGLIGMTPIYSVNGASVTVETSRG